MTEGTCIVAWCSELPRLDGLCTSHRKYRERYGRLPARQIKDTPLARFLDHVEQTETCWLWTGATGGRGRYGHFKYDGALTTAHRAAWLLMRGPIPDGLVIDHLCRVTLCVRPDHLEPVTQRENIRRGDRRLHPPPIDHLSGPMCSHGHAYTPENTVWRKNGSMSCRTCNRAYKAAFRARRKEVPA